MSPPPDRRVEFLPLESIRPARRNVKAHDVGAIVESIARFGFADAVVLDERTGRLVSGHGRIEALLAMRKEGRVPPSGVVVDEEGNWRVPVQRGWSSRDDADAEAFIVAANRLVELGGWDAAGLEAVLVDLARVGSLAGTGYDADDVDKLIAETARPLSAPDEVEEVPADVWVKPGDLFALGAHRLFVGDSTRPEDLAALMGATKQVDAVVTDPPYAIFGSSTGIGSDIADDKMVRPFFENIARTAHRVLKLFGHAYFFTDWRSYPALVDGAKRAALAPRNCIVWDKGGGGLGSMWAQCHEFVGFFVKAPVAKSIGQNERRGHRQVYKPNLQRFPRVTGEDREHNAAKPVALCAELVDAATDEGEVVLDLFAGSGSTLLACEATGRRCLAMEIEPKFAQVVIGRWERKTGRKAEKIAP